MFGLFVDLSDAEVLEKIQEHQIDYDVEPDEEMPDFFKAYVNCRSLPDLFTREEEAHRAILAHVVGWENFYENVKGK